MSAPRANSACSSRALPLDCGPRSASSTHYARARAAIDRKTKPLGSLGALEEVCCRLAAIQRRRRPAVEAGRVLLFAADHGVAEEGVSAFPQVVTRQMVETFATGGAAINVIARSVGLSVEIVDVGVAGEPVRHSNVICRRVRSSTRNLVRVAAMTEAECLSAARVGTERAEQAYRDGMHCIVLAEMGIGNSTSAAALVGTLLQRGARETVGRGTGVSGAVLARKRRVVTRAIARVRSHEPFRCLCELGGLEIAALVGAAVQGARRGLVLLADGVISSAAALVAVRLFPETNDYLFFGHKSPEPGHSLILRSCGQAPLLDLGLRLGEGSGAALAFPLLRSAARVLNEMASFSSARVSRGRA